MQSIALWCTMHGAKQTSAINILDAKDTRILIYRMHGIGVFKQKTLLSSVHKAIMLVDDMAKGIQKPTHTWSGPAERGLLRSLGFQGLNVAP